MSDAQVTTIYIGTFEVQLSLIMSSRRRAYNAKLCLATLGHAFEFDLSFDPEAATKLHPTFKTSVSQAFGLCKGQLVRDYNQMDGMIGKTTSMEVACVQNSYTMLGWMSIFGFGTRFKIVAGSAIHKNGNRVAHCWLRDSETDKIYDVASEWYSDHNELVSQDDEEWEVAIAELFRRRIQSVSPLRAWLEVAATGMSPLIGYAKMKAVIASYQYYLDNKRMEESNATNEDHED
jgi:hypothetical protein